MISEDSGIVAIKASGPEAVRWLAWAVEHGHRPDPQRQATPKSSPPFDKQSPDSFNERAQAAWILAWLYPQNEAAIPALRRALEDGDDAVADAAAHALNQMQPLAWSVLIQAAENRSPRVRRLAVRSLYLVNYGQAEYAGRPPRTDEDITRVIDALAKAFADPDPLVRSEAAHSFGNSRDAAGSSPILTAALPGALKLLSDPAPAVREQAGWAAYAFGAEASAAVPRMLDLLHDPEPEVRAAMARALSSVDSKEWRCISGLLTLAQDSELKCRVAAAAALGKFGIKADAVIAELIQRLNDVDPQVRGNTLNTLLQIGTTAIDAIPAMFTAMQQPTGKIDRGLVVFKMSRYYGPEIAPYLLQALAHPNPEVRSGAAMGLDECTFKHSPEFTAALSKAANDPDERVRSYAKRALGNTKPAP